LLKPAMLSRHILLFFFSSRRRHTSWPRDWSSDVCSSDLPLVHLAEGAAEHGAGVAVETERGAVLGQHHVIFEGSIRIQQPLPHRSEERRVGKSVDIGARRRIKKKKRYT